jgi:hypothetical protein
MDRHDHRDHHHTGIIHMTLPIRMSAPRFSDDELVDIINATRLRSRVMRDKGPVHDRIDLLIAHQPGSAYRFERDATGWTYLVHIASDQWKLIASGSLADCLSTFAVRSTP